MPLLVAIHLSLTFFMTGLCWFVQVVHYPLFRYIRIDDFANYERKNFVTAFITVPVMTAEWITGFWLLWTDPGLLWYGNAFLMILIGISTFAFQVPTHLKLASDPKPKHIEFLIRSNWIRTVSWTLRSELFVLFLVIGDIRI